MSVGTRAALSFFATAVLATAAVAQSATTQTGGPPLTVEDVVRLKRLSDPQISPDGHYVAYVLRETDMEANKGRTDIWLLDLKDKGAQPRRFTTDPAHDSSPRWAPDSRSLFFLSTRSGQSQVWRQEVSGGNALRVTDYPLDIGSLKVAPRGDLLALSMDVLPDCADLLCTKDKLAAVGKEKATGRLYDKLFIRHWDTWSNGTRSHLFVARLVGAGSTTTHAGATAGTPVNLTKSLDAKVPRQQFGSD